MLSLDFTILVCSLLWQHAWLVLFSLYSCFSFKSFSPPVTVRKPIFLSPHLPLRCFLTLLFTTLLPSQCLLVSLFGRFYYPRIVFCCKKRRRKKKKALLVITKNRSSNTYFVCTQTNCQYQWAVLISNCQTLTVEAEILHHSQSSAWFRAGIVTSTNFITNTCDFCYQLLVLLKTRGCSLENMQNCIKYWEKQTCCTPTL